MDIFYYNTKTYSEIKNDYIKDIYVKISLLKMRIFIFFQFKEKKDRNINKYSFAVA